MFATLNIDVVPCSYLLPVTDYMSQLVSGELTIYQRENYRFQKTCFLSLQQIFNAMCPLPRRNANTFVYLEVRSYENEIGPVINVTVKIEK